MQAMNDLFALGTHSDWACNGGAWGLPGHHRIADITKAAGITRLYWRTHNGGQATYPSRICRISDGSVYRDPNFKGFATLPKSYFAYARYLDYSKWDQVADMAAVGAEAGLETCHWYTVFEDDHGGHLTSSFIEAHPHMRCTLRDGRQVNGCLDFWYPEVRAYKLAVVDELLERPTSRLLLDFLRRNGTPSADANGDYRYGYNPEIIAAFKQQSGIDPEHIRPGMPEWEAWLDFNARPLTDFIREVAQRLQPRGIPLDLLVWAVDPRKWQALDIRTLAAEGLVDSIQTGSHNYAFSAHNIRMQVDTLRNALGTHGHVAVCPTIFAYNQLPPRTIDDCLEAVDALDVGGLVLHENNHLIECPISDRLRAWSYGKPHSRRCITAGRDSAAAARNEGFIKCHDVSGAACDQHTVFTVHWDDDALFLNITCSERDVKGLLPVPQIGTDNYNGNQLGARTFNPYESIQILIDTTHQHEDYHNFIVDPSAARMCGSRLDETWSGDWSAAVDIGGDAWTARVRLPWDTLSVKPQAGQTFGFQMFRIQNNPRELSAWFCTTGRRINPIEFGHLKLKG